MSDWAGFWLGLGFFFGMNEIATAIKNAAEVWREKRRGP